MSHKEAIEELEGQIEWLKEQLSKDNFSHTNYGMDKSIVFKEIMQKQKELVELKANKGKEL